MSCVIYVISKANLVSYLFGCPMRILKKPMFIVLYIIKDHQNTYVSDLYIKGHFYVC